MLSFTNLGLVICSYCMVFILLAFDIFKFTKSEAVHIIPLLKNGHVFKWVNTLMSIRFASVAIGIIEVLIAFKIGARFTSSHLCIYGSQPGYMIFFCILNFLIIPPGMVTKPDGTGLPDALLSSTFC